MAGCESCTNGTACDQCRPAFLLLKNGTCGEGWDVVLGLLVLLLILCRHAAVSFLQVDYAVLCHFLPLD